MHKDMKPRIKKNPLKLLMMGKEVNGDEFTPSSRSNSH